MFVIDLKVFGFVIDKWENLFGVYVLRSVVDIFKDDDFGVFFFDENEC